MFLSNAMRFEQSVIVPFKLFDSSFPIPLLPEVLNHGPRAVKPVAGWVDEVEASCASSLDHPSRRKVFSGEPTPIVHHKTFHNLRLAPRTLGDKKLLKNLSVTVPELSIW